MSSSNVANGVTSPNKVKELASMFQSFEPPKTGSSSASGMYEAKAARRAYAVGKASIIIEDKDSKTQTSRVKPGSKVGELAQNYHHSSPSYMVPKPPTSPAPAAYAPPLPSTPSPASSVALRAAPAAIDVSGSRGFARQSSSASVRISSWDESKAGEIQPTESVRERAARMNSQDNGAGPMSPPPTPGRLNASAIYPQASPQKPLEEVLSPPNALQNGYQNAHESSEERDTEDRYQEQDAEDEDQEEDRGYRADDNEEDREEDASSSVAEDDGDAGHYQDHEAHQEEHSARAEEEQEEARSDDEDGRDDDDDNDGGRDDDHDGRDEVDAREDEDAREDDREDNEDRRSNDGEDEDNGPVDDDDE